MFYKNAFFLGFFNFSEGGIQKIIWTKCPDDKNSPDLNELERHLKHIQSIASNLENK